MSVTPASRDGSGISGVPPQYWYHYEFWEKGDRTLKSSKYIPKGKLVTVQQLDDQKAPMREILKLLGVIR